MNDVSKHVVFAQKEASAQLQEGRARTSEPFDPLRPIQLLCCRLFA